MKPGDTTRRRVLAGLGAAAAVGLGGWAAGRRDQEPTANTLTTESSPENHAAFTGMAAEDSSTSAPATTTTTARPSLEVEVICRSAWGAAGAAPGENHEIERLTLHHTAVVLSDNSEAPARARSHQRYHLDSGFTDLAYHFMVDLEGNVFEGRSPAEAGETFTEYDPTGHFLVCCEGNFDEQSPTEMQLESVARLFAWAASEFAVDVSTLSGHRDHASTTCPGNNLYAALADGSLAAAVWSALETGVVRHDLCDEAGATRVAQIESP